MDAISTRRVFLGVEQSATGRVWRDRLDERGNLRALSIVQRHGLPELLARIVAGRGIEAEDVDAYLDPTVKRLMPDPSTLTAMDAAAARIADAVVRRDAIAIFGDYDVDGATSSAVLALFLRHAGLEPLIYIPDRITEGYGPNAPALPQEVDPRRPFTFYNLDSLQAIKLTGNLERWLRRELSPELAYDFPTIELLARHLAASEG